MPFERQVYPAHLIDVVHLSERRRVIVRPVLPQDDLLLRSLVKGLSAQSRHSRFMMGISELSLAMAHGFSNIDYATHFALVAVQVEGSAERIVADARYVVDENAVEDCEFAITVADDWQGLGLGRILLKRLLDSAALSNFARMHGHTLATNRAMTRLARSCGFSIVNHAGIARMRIALRGGAALGAAADFSKASPVLV